jgi:light-regulated signal transduction histidine kinase (bacteriophytochrome)
VHLTARPVGDRWEVECRDNGIGIDAQYAERVFVIFQRLHAKDAYEGTGIGLSLCKKIVEHHGGQIWLEPLPDGPGTSVRFTLPAVPTAPDDDVPPDPAGATPPVPVAVRTGAGTTDTTTETTARGREEDE